MSESSERDAIFRYSYSRGTVLLLYALGWLAASVGGYVLLDATFAAGGGLAANLLFAAGAAGLAGGVGGATALLTNLSRHVAAEQNLQEQPLGYYWVMPVLGLVAGLLTLLLIAIPAQLIINFATTGQLVLDTTFATATFTALQMVIAWTGGFYQQRGIKRLRAALKLDSPAPASRQKIDPNDPLAWKEWYKYRVEVIRWSYTWGLLALGYNVLWLAGALASLLLLGQTALLNPEAVATETTVAVVLAAWPAVVAGALGGVVAALYRLYRSVSHTQDFDRQDLMFYLVQPPVGAVFGGVIYFLVASGYFSLSPVFSPGVEPTIVDSPTVVMIQMALGWLVGFRQEAVNQLTLKLVADIVRFFRVASKFLNPKVWFNQAERNAIWAELGFQREVFTPDDAEPPQARSVWSDLPTDLN
ncbi:MAG: hypothetical protein Kow0031_07710 [Anaerolineae bacterium]